MRLLCGLYSRLADGLTANSVRTAYGLVLQHKAGVTLAAHVGLVDASAFAWLGLGAGCWEGHAAAFVACISSNTVSLAFPAIHCEISVFPTNASKAGMCSAGRLLRDGLSSVDR